MFLVEVGEYMQNLKGDLIRRGTRLIQKITSEPIKTVKVQVQQQTVFSSIRKTFQWRNERHLISQSKKLTVFKDNKLKDAQSVPLTKHQFDEYSIKQINKIKLWRKMEPISGFLKQRSHIMKVVVNRVNKLNVYYASDPSIIEEYFQKIILVKVCLYQLINLNLSKTKGNMLKKSNFFGIWENIYATFDQKQGLKCYAQKNQPCDMQIKCIHEIWTWFDLIQDEKYLVIKIKQYKSKRQFAIPLVQLTNWIPVFMKLLSKPQI